MSNEKKPDFCGVQGTVRSTEGRCRKSPISAASKGTGAR